MIEPITNQTIWATSFFTRIRGLLFRKGFQGCIVFAPCKSIHTYGMKTDIDVAFIGRTGQIIQAKKGVRPNKILSCAQAVATIERLSTNTQWFTVGQTVSIQSVDNI